MTSKFTKITRRKFWIVSIISYILLAAPLITYVIMALANDGVLVSGKVAIVGTVMTALVLTGFNLLAQKHFTCPIWIVLLGLYIAMREMLMPLIILLAVTTILDDLVFNPLINYYRTKLIASKTMDERESCD